MLGCLLIRDAFSGQDVKIEAYGANAVRVRAVPSGAAFRDEPDVISALLPPSQSRTTGCRAASLTIANTTQTLVNGNLNASVLADGRLVFPRVSDGKPLLGEKSVRHLEPTTTSTIM